MDTDTDNHERLAPALHPECIHWAQMRLDAAVKYRESAEVQEGFEKLLAFARGEK